MAEIEIKIVDRVDTSIAKNLKSVAVSAKEAHSAVMKLQTQLNVLNARALNTIMQASANATKALLQTATAAAKLATEQAKTATAAAKLAAEEAKAAAATQKLGIEQAKVAAANNQAATAAQKLATEQAKTASAAAQTAAIQTAAAQKLATAQQQTATASAQTAAAQQRVGMAATQASTAQQNLATATARTAQVENQAAVAAQKLATEEARTATQTALAAAASDRAAASALRLAKAQETASKAAKSAASTMLSYIRIAAGALGAGLGAQAIMDAADAYVTVQNKLVNVTESQEQVNTLTERMFELANKTRTSVEATATAFSRFDRALKNMGKSQEESLRLTETVNKTLIVSGATAKEASSALLQLSQSFNSGRLQGEEFRAVSESMPAVLDALAFITKKSAGELKKMGAEGKLTADLLYKAFKSIEDVIDLKFSKTVSTISQAMEVASNNATRFFGQMGISQAVAGGILTLSNNFKELAVAAVGVGTAMLTAFGPQIRAAIVATSNAVKAFMASLAANPIAAVAAALVTLISYLAIFKRDIRAGLGDLTTFGDLAEAAFEKASMAAGELWASIGDSANKILSAISVELQQSVQEWMGSFSNFFKTTNSGWAGFFEIIARLADRLIVRFSAVTRFISKLWVEVKEAFVQEFSVIADKAQNAMTEVANSVIEGMNVIREALGQEKLELIPFKEIKDKGAFEFSDMGELWRKSLEESFAEHGSSAQETLDSIFSRARQIGEERRRAMNTKLRGPSASALSNVTDEKAAKAAQRRVDALAKINRELDNELERMFMLEEEREKQARFDAIEEQLANKKITLTQTETKVIKDKIDAIIEAGEVQQKFDEIYREATDPLEEYNDAMEAADRLLKQNALSQQQYDYVARKTLKTYRDSVNPLHKLNEELEKQARLMKMAPFERNVEQNLQQWVAENVDKMPWDTDPDAALRTYMEAERMFQIHERNVLLMAEADNLLDQSVNKRQQEIDQLIEIHRLLKEDPRFTKNDAIAALAGSAMQPVETGSFLVGSPEVLNAELDRLDKHQKRILEMQKDANKKSLISDQTAITARYKIWNAKNDLHLSGTKEFLGNLEALQASSNKRIARIGKAAAIAQALISTYQSANAAFAAMAGIKVVGPALGTMAASAAVIAGMLNVERIRSVPLGGYAQGGYTGNIPENEVAGVVHGGEFVMDAKSVDRIGLANLRALQSGANSVNQNKGPVRPVGIQRPVPANTTVNMRNINVLDPAIVGNYLSSPQGERVFINTLRRNSDQVRQIVQNG